MARQKVSVVEESNNNVEVMEDISSKETDNKFEALYDSDTGVVTFELTDGTPVSMKSPKTRQFLLLESFMKQSPEEYKTESFLALKLASLCINKYAGKSNISFEELIDILEIEDVERVAAALTFFQDKFVYLSKPASL